MPSAMVERQILPRQTKRTETGSDILRIKRVGRIKENEEETGSYQHKAVVYSLFIKVWQPVFQRAEGPALIGGAEETVQNPELSHQ